MDITIDVGDYKLNVRGSVLIEHNGKILAHRNINSNHYALVGGRVEIGEDSETTVKREIENFFEMKGSKYHEILFVHKGEFVNEEDKKIEYTLKNLEGKDYLQYEWLDISKIDEYPLWPVLIKDGIKENKFPVHKIFKDNK